jgi:hypothetical protein
MKLQKNIAISDAGYLFNPSTGESFSVNPIGIEIINLMREGKSETEISRKLADEYQSEGNTILQDLHDFFHMLKQYQLIENNG